jgi:hypothetical protein
MAVEKALTAPKGRNGGAGHRHPLEARTGVAVVHRRLGPSSSATTSTACRTLPPSAVQVRCWTRPTTRPGRQLAVHLDLGHHRQLVEAQVHRAQLDQEHDSWTEAIVRRTAASPSDPGGGQEEWSPDDAWRALRRYSDWRLLTCRQHARAMGHGAVTTCRPLTFI